MSPLEYLSQKVGKITPGSDKVYNEGARLLACFPDWELHLERFIQESWNTLLKYCVRNKQSTYSYIHCQLKLAPTVLIQTELLYNRKRFVH